MRLHPPCPSVGRERIRSLGRLQCFTPLHVKSDFFALKPREHRYRRTLKGLVVKFELKMWAYSVALN
jgi:hypothetical protein